MAGFSHEIAACTRKPAAIVSLPTTAWASEWPDKPTQEVAVGLSLLSERDLQTVRAEAAKEANELHPGSGADDPDWVDARNDALMAWAVSLALREPDDAALPVLPMQDEDEVRRALSGGAIRHLWDELERASIVNSPVRSEATDEEVERLAHLLLEGHVEKLASPSQTRLRKLLSFALDELLLVADMDLDQQDSA